MRRSEFPVLYKLTKLDFKVDLASCSLMAQDLWLELIIQVRKYMPHVVRFLVILIIGSRRFGFIVSTLEQPSQLLFWAKKKGKHGNQIGYTYLFFYSWYPTGTKHVHYLFISQLASSQQ